MSQKLIQQLNNAIVPCHFNEPLFCEKIASWIGNARIVLMGEATHGTQEFYQARMHLSEYLIQNKGFHAIAIEGDWTSVYPGHQFCQGNTHEGIQTALEGFKHFPAWMWRNKAMLAFLQNLQAHNLQTNQPSKKVAFYGLDLYCLQEAAQNVIAYLQQYHPEIVPEAIRRYACIDEANADAESYRYLIKTKLKKSCAKEVAQQFLEMQRLESQRITTSLEATEHQFYATQNARVVKNAENYYRSLFEPHYVTWNIRDQHMADTLQSIIAHLESVTQEPAKVIVWAHNSHIGDARATEMAERQELNLGQLVRERFGDNAFLLGFSTAVGTVTAASQWGGKPYYKNIQPPLSGSYEHCFHTLQEKNFILSLRDKAPWVSLLNSPQLQRAIGVLYLPETERDSHYYFSHLPYQFDAIAHFDKTSALIPLDHQPSVESKRFSDLYPEGL